MKDHEILLRAAEMLQDSIPPLQSPADLMLYAKEVIAHNLLLQRAKRMRLAEISEDGEQAEIPEPESDPEPGLTAEGTGFETPAILTADGDHDVDLTPGKPVPARADLFVTYQTGGPYGEVTVDNQGTLHALGGSIRPIDGRLYVRGPREHADQLLELAEKWRDAAHPDAEVLPDPRMVREPATRRHWTVEEDDRVRRYVQAGVHFSTVLDEFPARTAGALDSRFSLWRAALAQEQDAAKPSQDGGG